MKVLLGEMTGKNVKRLQKRGWGRMWIARDRKIYTYPGEPWGLDNGAYRDHLAGEEFSEAAFEKALGRAMDQKNPPYMIVLPDVVSGGRDSLRMSERWAYTLQDDCLPLFLVAQDGFDPVDTRHLLPLLKGIFLGGGNSFKARAGEWKAFAHSHGLLFHYGRCGTQGKVAHAIRIGADSLDSAYPTWTQERWEHFEDMIENGPPQFDAFDARGVIV